MGVFKQMSAEAAASVSPHSLSPCSTTSLRPWVTVPDGTDAPVRSELETQANVMACNVRKCVSLLYVLRVFPNYSNI